MIRYRFGPFRLDKEQLMLSLEDAPIALGPKVVETLLALVEHPGEVLSKTELLERVWPEGFVEEANLAQNIYVIRKALKLHWPGEAIETVPRRGYRFTAPVSCERLAHQHVAEPLEQPAPRARRPFTFAAAAAALVLALGATLAGLAHTHRAADAGLSADGARLYAMGKFYWNQRTADGVSKSLRYFGQVTGTDPRDPRGYAGLALAYAIEGDYGYGPLTKNQAFTRAKRFADRALSINENSAEAHAALGLVEIKAHHATAGQIEYRRAIALDPQYAPAHQWYGMALLREGRGKEAYDELHEAAVLDPESVAATDWLSEAAYLSRHYTQAIRYAQQALDLSPQRTDAYQAMGLAYEALGDYRAAIAAYERYANSCAACRPEVAALLAHVYAASHDYVSAAAQLRIARAGMASDSVDPEDVITALVAMGRRTEALEMLRRAHRSTFSGMLAIDPRMDPVRDDARFRPFTQGPA
ncbi:MAG TPA: winged helix-turn-helix domain-containing protein [Candidatus Baltobacteraceae bacterium]|nr:winged helix-turn-helix domain-containing protein [Candidatus Baltobacteraceae bacterium]